MARTWASKSLPALRPGRGEAGQQVRRQEGSKGMRGELRGGATWGTNEVVLERTSGDGTE
eukprot:2795572-Pleurochrysis_carterae.AAC.1